MDIMTCNGGFAVSMSGLDSFHYKWNKDKTISIWENKKAKYKLGAVSITTNYGEFIEALNEADEVVWRGGDGGGGFLKISAKPIRLRFRKLPKPELSKHDFEKARKIVTRYLYSDSPYSLGVNAKLSEAIKILQAKLREVPKAYRHTAEIEFRDRMSYGESYQNVEITWREPETDDELMLRLTIEAERDRVSLAKKKEDLAKLKEELGGRG